MQNFGFCLIPILLVLMGFRKYRERKWGYCTNKAELDGQVAIITGCNTGIGYEIAKELAARNACVILACRNLDSAKLATRRIERDLRRSVKLITMELDLASLESVKNFADSVKKQFSKIHILVNNAGVAYPKKEIHHRTKDGYEIHFGVNHLGHFYLTNLLLDSMGKSRIVILVSSLHEKGIIDFDNLSVHSSGNLYANSKLANVYFCRELARRLKDSEISVYAVCPGWVFTSLFRHSVRWYHYILLAPIAFCFMRSSKQGAQTPIYCATEPGLQHESGLLYRDCNIYQSKVKFREDIGIRLWEESEKLIKQAINLYYNN